MHLKSLLGSIAIAATVVGAQAPQAATKAPAQAPTQAPAKAPANASTTAQAAAASYKKEVPAKLAAKAKVTEAAAAATALAKVPGGKIESVELEEEDGKLIYSYDIKVAGKKGIEEIQVDAMTGAIAKAEHEDPATEAKEAAEDKKGAKKPTAPSVKKP